MDRLRDIDAPLAQEDTLSTAPVNRITVNLSDEAQAALDRAVARKRRKKTTVVELALVRNDFLEEHLLSGVYVMNEAGELERVHLL